GKFDDDQRREMKDHVVRVVSMRREDLARSRMVLTHNYEGLINDAAKAVNLKKVQESIDKANVANELAMESNKISERSLEQSGSSHRFAWAGVWLALGGIVLTLYFSLWRNTDVEDDTSSIMYEIVDDSTALLITTVGDSMLAEDGTALSDDAWPDTLNDSTRLH
ncbi:MAG: hypothetical protein IH855_00990, partial [Bacteroidetes bacterium]|nr:hypothetical protein [Bacteroidota bacterium]